MHIPLHGVTPPVQMQRFCPFHSGGLQPDASMAASSLATGASTSGLSPATVADRLQPSTCQASQQPQVSQTQDLQSQQPAPSRVKNVAWDTPNNTIALHPLAPLVPSATPSKNSGGTSEALAAERAKASFDVTLMTNFLDGGAKATAKRRFIISPTKNMEMPQKYSMTREELLKHHLIHFNCVHDPFTDNYVPTREEVGWMQENTMNSGSMMNHWGLFVPTLLMQGSDEQKAIWLSRAMMGEIIGCYAQTELGHGSNVRGLRTVATFDKASKCFIIDTPELSATKWWPGGLGKVSTHAIVYAQLILDGQEHGVQAFIVQIRDENHRPMPGIEVGDLGNKLGDASNDTGFLRLHRVRVPLDQMLSRYQRVTEDGKFMKVRPKGETDEKTDKVSYATMAFSRGAMVRQSGGMLARAVTIAIRYSAIRRQGFKYPSVVKSHRDEEVLLIDHHVQRRRLFTQLATAYALKFAGKHVLNLFSQLEGGSVAGGLRDLSSLAETAATAAGLKALCCVLAADGIEECRKCCGGNGYLLSSGIAALGADYVWQTTAEGDTVVLLLQTARFNLKQLAKARGGEELAGPLKYLEPLASRPLGGGDDKGLAQAIEKMYKPIEYKLPQDLSKEWEINALAARVQWLANAIDMCAIAELATAEYELEEAKQALLFQEKDKGSLSEEDLAKVSDTAWAQNSIVLCSAAIWHCLGFIVHSFAESIRECPDLNCRLVLYRLAALFAANVLLDRPLSAKCIELLPHLTFGLANMEVSGVVEEELKKSHISVQACARPNPFLAQVTKLRYLLLEEIRTDAVALVDAFDYPNRVLNSAIGAYEGNVYEALMEAARRSPLNQQDPFPGYEDTIRKKLDLELLAEGRIAAEKYRRLDAGDKLPSQL